MNHLEPSTGRQGRRIVDRETKLALLIGFIAILVVGVLVSDHLSDDGRDELADVTAGDAALAPPIVMPPLESARRGPIEPPPLERTADGIADRRAGSQFANAAIEGGHTPLVGVRLEHQPPREAPRSEQPDRSREQPSDRQSGQQVRPDRTDSDGGRERPEPEQTRERSVTPRVQDGPPVLHIVTSGETLGEIAQRHLGSAARWREIQQANSGQVPADGAIRVGMRLVIPVDGSSGARAEAEPTRRGETVPRESSRQESSGRSSQNAWSKSYTVVEGDTLWRIAQRELGDGGRWREILNANDDVIPGDGGVTVGMRIRLPGQGGTQARSQQRPEPQTQSPPRATSGTRSYTVREGDALSRIASRELGSASRMQEILDLNRGVLDDADMIRVGMTIRLPAN